MAGKGGKGLREQACHPLQSACKPLAARRPLSALPRCPAAGSGHPRCLQAHAAVARGHLAAGDHQHRCGPAWERPGVLAGHRGAARANAALQAGARRPAGSDGGGGSGGTSGSSSERSWISGSGACTHRCRQRLQRDFSSRATWSAPQARLATWRTASRPWSRPFRACRRCGSRTSWSATSPSSWATPMPRSTSVSGRLGGAGRGCGPGCAAWRRGARAAKGGGADGGGAGTACVQLHALRDRAARCGGSCRLQAAAGAVPLAVPLTVGGAGARCCRRRGPAVPAPRLLQGVRQQQGGQPKVRRARCAPYIADCFAAARAGRRGGRRAAFHTAALRNCLEACAVLPRHMPARPHACPSRRPLCLPSLPPPRV